MGVIYNAMFKENKIKSKVLRVSVIVSGPVGDLTPIHPQSIIHKSINGNLIAYE